MVTVTPVVPVAAQQPEAPRKTVPRPIGRAEDRDDGRHDGPRSGPGRVSDRDLAR